MSAEETVKERLTENRFVTIINFHFPATDLRVVRRGEGKEEFTEKR
jgi:hypothetical protein